MGIPAYSREQQVAGQRAMVHEGIFSRTMESVTTGIILIGFALALGANDMEIGLIAAIPFLAHLVHLPAVAMLARTRDRRAMTVRAAVAARLVLFLIALVPIVAMGGTLRPVHALIPLLVVYSLLANLSGASWQVWVRDLVPREELGRYFGRRMAILATVGVVVTLAAGQFVNVWSDLYPERALRAFAILFAFGGVMGMISALFVRSAPMIHATLNDIELYETLRRPFNDANYRRVLVFLAAWGFAANFSLPFVAIVLLSTLGYPLGTVVLFAALSAAINVVALKVWGPVTDKFGNKPVLGLGASVFVLAIAAWALTPKEPGTFVLLMAGVVFALLGLAAAALDLASNGLVMKLAPDDDVPAFLATASVARSVATGIAPLLGGVVAALLAGRSFSVRFAWTTPEGETMVTALQFVHYDFLFIISAILGLYAVHRLLGFVEEGEVPPSRVLRSMRQDVGQFSGVVGLRPFAHLASYVIEGAYGLQRTMDMRRLRESLDDDEGEEP